MTLPPGALVNDWLCTLGEQTFWHTLLAEFPGLQDWTGEAYHTLANSVEQRFFDAEDSGTAPQYIIRNATYFRPLRVPVPQIVLLQDIAGSGMLREWQNQVIASCQWVVMNSPYVASLYPEITTRYSLIPVAVDLVVFPFRGRSKSEQRSSRVCWVGSGDPVKGMDLFQQVVAATPYDFVMITKDGAVWQHPRVTCYPCVPQSQLVDIVASCDAGLCTSQVETQHLAGIEMGYVGLPMVTTNVGTYYDRPAGVWGSSGTAATLVERLHAVLVRDQNPVAVREYWVAEHAPDVVLPRWRAVIETVLAG